MRFEEISENLTILQKYFGISPSDISYNDGKISIRPGVSVSALLHFNEIPVKFGTVDASFMISNSGLRSLKNSPEVLSGSFNCRYNFLKNLEFGPKYVGDSYRVTGNPIETLKFLPGHCVLFTIDYHPNLELLRLFNIDDLVEVMVATNDHRIDVESINRILNKILIDTELNKQQKILTAKRELIKYGFESNAKF